MHSRERLVTEVDAGFPGADTCPSVSGRQMADGEASMERAEHGDDELDLNTNRCETVVSRNTTEWIWEKGKLPKVMVAFPILGGPAKHRHGGKILLTSRHPKSEGTLQRRKIKKQGKATAKET